MARLWTDIDKDGNTEVAVSLFRAAVVSFMACFDKSNAVGRDAHSLYQPYESGPQYFQ